MPQNLPAQAQKFAILMKKASLGVRSPWIEPFELVKDSLIVDYFVYFH